MPLNFTSPSFNSVSTADITVNLEFFALISKYLSFSVLVFAIKIFT